MFIAYHLFFNYETRLMVIDKMTAKTQDVYQPSITNGIAGKELLGRWVINNKYWGRNIEIKRMVKSTCLISFIVMAVKVLRN